MNKKRYVQHISGQGEKWQVNDEGPYSWEVSKPYCYTFEVPKSEYHLCDPPEEWEDITKNYKFLDGEVSVNLGNNEEFRYIDHLHNGPSFIIERKKS